MATYAFKSIVSGVTAASGVAGATAIAGLQNTAMVTVLAGIQATTGYVTGSLTVSPAELLYDTAANIYVMQQTCTYIIQS